MPYAGPPDSPTSSPRARNHRRSHSSNTYFSDEKGPGAFVSLGALPKLQRKPTPKKVPTFHFRDDDDDDDDSSPEDSPHQSPRLSIDTQNLSSPKGVTTPPRVVINSEPLAPNAVPFPVSSPLSGSPTQQETPALTTASTASTSDASRRPTLSRGSSHPILLSNGKPLKSSLKSSASASSIPEDVRSMHMRVQSAPTTPFLTKSVHFPEKKEDGLESVLVFNRKARPASVSTGGGDDTETETEREDRFPFPRFGPSSTIPPVGTAAGATAASVLPVSYEIDWESGRTSPVPPQNPPENAHIYLESLSLTQPNRPNSPLAPAAPQLTGTILVRNVAFEKQVAVRFTLDDWQTTSEVHARHVVSVMALPWEKKRTTLGDAVALIANSNNSSSGGSTWDRFSFTIRLEDYAYKLQERTLYLVGRYQAGPNALVGEWWDNNGGMNYRAGFKASPAKIREDTGRTVSAPEPVTKPLTTAVPTRVGYGVGFEFPTSMSNPVVDNHAVNGQMNGTSTVVVPPAIRPIPPPPITRREVPRPKLNLKNYAAPSLSPTLNPIGPRSSSRSPLNSPPVSTANAANPFGFLPEVKVTPPVSPTEENGPKSVIPGLSGFGLTGWAGNSATPRASSMHQNIIGGQPASMPFSPTRQDITLHWPWGLNASPPPPGSAASSSVDRYSPPGSGSSTPQRTYSPKTMSPLASNTPTHSQDSSPQSGSGSASPRESLQEASRTGSDQLYEAFVKQWCFAQSPGPGPGPGHGGHGVGTPGFLGHEGGFGEGVLVG